MPRHSDNAGLSGTCPDTAFPERCMAYISVVLIPLSFRSTRRCGEEDYCCLGRPALSEDPTPVLRQFYSARIFASKFPSRYVPMGTFFFARRMQHG